MVNHMDPHQVPGAYFILGLFERHIIFANAIEPANVGVKAEVEVVEIKDNEDEEEDGLEFDDLVRPEILSIVLPAVPPEPAMEIADLENAPPLVFNEDGGYDAKPRHICRFRLWPSRI